MVVVTDANLRRFGWFERVKRIARYRLHIPLKRSTLPPEHLARGVMVGVIWASTPIFGLQMAAVFTTWLVARKLFSWDFSLINGLAWTWATNAFTIIPAFYVFWLTGQIMLGRFNDLTGYSSFKTIVEGWHVEGMGWIEGLMHKFNALFDTIGLPLTLGCIPWAVLLGWIAYRLTYRFVIGYRQARAERMAERANGN